ncbi:MAG: hypothetical protein QOF99_7890 [Pseudonocardiales bacterium]|jgi:hypothetical protein|nr:hypothetical protein [Pseudonocardiales bacterium]
MQHTIRRAVAVTVAVGALVTAGAGLAYADSDDDSPSQSAGPGPGPGPGGGSGLSGGPTHTQVLKGAPSVPLSDPTLGESTLLPPVYNAIG